MPRLTGSKRVAGILVIAAAVRLVAMVPAIGDETRLLGGDSKGYLTLAQQPACAYGGGECLTDLALLRPPGYPLFLWLGLEVSELDLFALMLLQALLGTGTVYLTYLLGKRLLGPEVAAWGALLLALEPVSVIHSSFVLSETLFTFAFVAALITLVAAVERRSLFLMTAAGGATAITAFIRPSGLYLPLILGAVIVVLARARGLIPSAAGWVLLGCFLAAALSPLQLWATRNERVAEVHAFSSSGSRNLLYKWAGGALSEDENITLGEARFVLDAQIPEGLSRADLFERHKSLAYRTLREHPIGALVGALKGVGRTLFGISQGEAFERGGARDVLARDSLPKILYVAIAGSYVAVLILAAGTGTWRLLRTKEYLMALSLAIPIGYFLLISAASYSNARFRIPFAPLLAILAGVAIVKAPTRKSWARL